MLIRYTRGSRKHRIGRVHSACVISTVEPVSTIVSGGSRTALGRRGRSRHRTGNRRRRPAGLLARHPRHAHQLRGGQPVMSTTSNDFVVDDGPDVNESTVVLPSVRTLTPSVVEEIVNATRAGSPVGRPSLSSRAGKSPLMTFRLSDELDTAVNQTGIAVAARPRRRRGIPSQPLPASGRQEGRLLSLFCFRVGSPGVSPSCSMTVLTSTTLPPVPASSITPHWPLSSVPVKVESFSHHLIKSPVFSLQAGG